MGIEILENYDLSGLNTFGVKANAKFFVEIKSEDDIKELFVSEVFKNNEKLFMGGGSNILFTKDFDGIIILNKLKGIEILEEDSDSVLIKGMGGENWHDLVLFVIDKGYWGMENLSLVPGTVGATPVQNIGAYGVEVKDILEKVEVYEIESGNKKTFSNKECEFGYRESIFKNRLKGKYFISSVIFKLSKLENKNTRYRTLQEHIEKNNLTIKNPKDISDIVIEIRKSKLPDPKVLGNAGSFFKNVFVEKEKLEELKKTFPEIPYFEDEEIINPVRSRPREASATVTLGRPTSNGVKIPAGWLIEQCGPANDTTSWKGKKIGNVGVHEKQALVLVNHGGATGKELKDLSDQIISSVFFKFGITLTREVNLI